MSGEEYFNIGAQLVYMNNFCIPAKMLFNFFEHTGLESLLTYYCND